MVFKAHGMSFSCTELLLFNYVNINTVFHSMAPLNKYNKIEGYLEMDYYNYIVFPENMFYLKQLMR